LKKIYFRADGNNNIGMGHVIRSLALADMLKNKFECVFVTRYINQYIVNEIEKSCSSFIILEKKENHFKEFLKLIQEKDIVVLDNYFFSTNYQKKIKKIGCKLICIDDTHDKNYVSDVVINHGPGLTSDQFTIESYTKLYIGLDYALLRKPFLNVVQKNRNDIKKCLVCIGGVDKYNITLKIIKLLEKNKNINRIDVVIGSGFLFKDELDNYIIKCNKEVKLYSNLSSVSMLNRMQKADFGIFPASSISLEAISVGLPFLVGYYVENQKELYRNLTIKYNLLGLGNFLNLNKISINKLILKSKINLKTSSKKLVEIFNQL
tara:strand:+ start:6364 stop:7323 length:960 start_codon:yes stop_codon:yes gene_type:complete